MPGCIVPSQVDARKFGACPILAHVVVFVEDTEEVIGMLFPYIFYAKIINYKHELDCRRPVETFLAANPIRAYS